VRKFSELQKVSDLDPDIGSGQGHIGIHNTCRTTSIFNHLTIASRTTDIWSFEFREISTFRDVWTLVITFLEGNSKIGLRQAVDNVPYYHHRPSVLRSTPKCRVATVCHHTIPPIHALGTNNEHRPAPLWLFCDFGSWCKCQDYLLTYSPPWHTRHCAHCQLARQ